MAITICTVSGTLKDPSGTAISGATIKAILPRPFLHAADNLTLIANFELSTTTDSSGNWSLNIVETTTNAITLTIALVYPQASATGNTRYEYTVMIPNSASATFASLITGEI